jgi:hypothetical protein
MPSCRAAPSRRARAVYLVAAACALAACGSTTTPASGTSVTQPLSAHLERAGPNPSISAEMVCAKEAREEIAVSLSVRESRVTNPTWKNHVYSCTYVYPKGSVTLSVKELVSAQTTADYFNSLERRLGRAAPLDDLGQGGFISKNDDAVVRKDYKVLLVDTHAIPQQFTPVMRRSDVAQNIAVVIMGCWSGA